MSEHEYDERDDEDGPFEDAPFDEDGEDGEDGEDKDDEDGPFEDDEVGAEGNRRVGATALGVLEYVARSIVDDRESVFVDAEEGSGRVTFHVHVAPDDMGRLIGKRGRVAHAIRAVVSAAAHRDGVRAEVEFED